MKEESFYCINFHQIVIFVLFLNFLSCNNYCVVIFAVALLYQIPINRTFSSRHFLKHPVYRLRQIFQNKNYLLDKVYTFYTNEISTCLGRYDLLCLLSSIYFFFCNFLAECVSHWLQLQIFTRIAYTWIIIITSKPFFPFSSALLIFSASLILRNKVNNAVVWQKILYIRREKSFIN